MKKFGLKKSRTGPLPVGLAHEAPHAARVGPDASLEPPVDAVGEK